MRRAWMTADCRPGPAFAAALACKAGDPRVVAEPVAVW